MTDFENLENNKEALNKINICQKSIYIFISLSFLFKNIFIANI